MFVGPQVGTSTRKAHLPQSPPQISPQIVPETSVSMSHEGGHDNMSKDEYYFRKSFFDMTQTVKVIYEESNIRLQGKRSKPPKGEGSSKGKEDMRTSLQTGMVPNHL